jgi:hypothetical protein
VVCSVHLLAADAYAPLIPFLLLLLFLLLVLVLLFLPHRRRFARRFSARGNYLN